MLVPQPLSSTPLAAEASAKAPPAVLRHRTLVPPVGHVEVNSAIVVEVAGGDTEAVTCAFSLDTAGGSDVRESQLAPAVGSDLQVVPVQVVATGRRWILDATSGSEGVALEGKDIEVVVEVEPDPVADFDQPIGRPNPRRRDEATESQSENAERSGATLPSRRVLRSTDSDRAIRRQLIVPMAAALQATQGID